MFSALTLCATLHALCEFLCKLFRVFYASKTGYKTETVAERIVKRALGYAPAVFVEPGTAAENS
jgi:hypothetical protein